MGDGNNNSVKHLQLKNKINGVSHSNDEDGHGSFASLRCYSRSHQTTWLELKHRHCFFLLMEMPSISSDDVDTRERTLLMAGSGRYSDAALALIWIFISRRKETHSVISVFGFYSAIAAHHSNCHFARRTREKINFPADYDSSMALFKKGFILN